MASLLVVLDEGVVLPASLLHALVPPLLALLSQVDLVTRTLGEAEAERFAIRVTRFTPDQVFGQGGNFFFVAVEPDQY